MKQPIFLRIYQDDRLLEVKQFAESQIVIGRSSDVQLSLDHGEVSPLHATIEERGGEYFISDLGSEKGTLVNDEAIFEKKIGPGDRIRIGPFVLQFSIGATVGVSAPTGPSVPKATIVEEPAKKASAPGKQFVAGAAAASVKPPLPKAATMPQPAKPSSTPVAPRAHAPKKGRWRNTFAPPSTFKSAKDVIKPGKGSVIEVLVAWKERIISTHHFAGKRTVTIGCGADVDVHLPFSMNGKAQHTLLKIDSQARVYVTGDMTGELIAPGSVSNIGDLQRQNKMSRGGGFQEILLNQGEMIRLGLHGELISIYVRYVPDAPKPLMAPMLDLTSSEATGLVLAMVLSALFGLYMSVYTPAPKELVAEKEPERIAIFKYDPPPRAPTPPEPPKETPPPPKPPPPPKKEVVKVTDQQKSPKRQTPDPGAAGGGAGGGGGGGSPKKQGGAVSTGKSGANMASEKRDVTKTGLLGVFGSKGVQTKLDQTYSGSGELQGIANKATGFAGQNENRPGANLGSKLRDTGAGGSGAGTVGIGNVGTQGRGSGNAGYGTGGIGEKGRATINASGQDAEISASLDKEGIRRVVQSQLKQIRACYDLELQRNPDLFGKISIQWDIDDQGKVTSAKVANTTMPNKEVGNCIVGRLKTWKFPPSPQDTVGQVSYPFVFTAQ